MKITKEQVVEAYNNLEKLKEWYPEAFEMELEVGFWYKSTTRDLNIIYLKSISATQLECFGFDLNGDWMELALRNKCGEYTKVTPQEIETALIKETINRGYRKGVICEFGLIKNIRTIKSDKLKYCKKDNSILLGSDIIFYNGTWATIIKPKQMTQEQIETELGYKIEIV